MISHRYKCIFIHIPKTAGTSIEQKLGHFEELERGVQDHRPIRDIEPISLDDLVQSIKNFNLSGFKRQLKKTIRDKQTNLRKCYDTYFKFAFVRNPWSRVFSWYKNVMRDDHHKNRYGVDLNCSFKDFLSLHMNHGELKPQLYWILDRKGNIPLDFVGRFENLDHDFGYVADIINLENKVLPQLVAGDGQSYIHHYDSEMKEIINIIYKDEIEYFNFKFGE